MDWEAVVKSLEESAIDARRSRDRIAQASSLKAESASLLGAEWVFLRLAHAIRKGLGQ